MSSSPNSKPMVTDVSLTVLFKAGTLLHTPTIPERF